MSWDPITRIIGSLGIHTKIDFANRQVAECQQHLVDLPRLQRLHARQGPARRPLHHQPHLRHLRRQPRHLRRLRAEHGLRRQPALARRVDHQPAARRPSTCSTTTSSRTTWWAWTSASRWCGRPTRACWRAAETTPAPHGDRHGYRTIADIMRALNPFSGRPLPRGAADEPPGARDVLPDGGAARPPLHALPGRRRHGAQRAALHRVPRPAHAYIDFVKRMVPLHDDLFDFFYEALPGYEEVGRRRVLLGCWGSFQDPEACDFRYETMTEWGREMYVTPGHRRRRRAAHHRPGGDQPRHPHPARQLVLRRLAGRRDLRQGRSARQPGRPAPPLEPDDHAPAAEARLRGQVHLGDVAALVRPAQRTATWPSTPAAARWRASGSPRWPAWSTSATSRRPATASRSACRRTADAAGDRARVEDPALGNTLERNRARTYFQAYAAAAALYFVERAMEEVHAGRTRDLDAVQGARRGDRLRLPRGGARPALAPHGHPRRARSPTTTPTRRPAGTPARATPSARPAPTRTRSRTRRCSRRTGRTTSRASTSCARCAASTPACPAACTCTWATARRSRSATRRPSGSVAGGGEADEPRARRRARSPTRSSTRGISSTPTARSALKNRHRWTFGVLCPQRCERGARAAPSPGPAERVPRRAAAPTPRSRSRAVPAPRPAPAAALGRAGARRRRSAQGGAIDAGGRRVEAGEEASGARRGGAAAARRPGRRAGAPAVRLRRPRRGRAICDVAGRRGRRRPRSRSAGGRARVTADRVGAPPTG